MYQNSSTVLRLCGIQIRIAASWFLIAALITWSLADQVFPAQIPGLAPLQYLALGLVAMVLFFASLVLHELAHAVVARALGIEVPRITLFLFGGVAELEDEPDHPSSELLISVAGPAMSAALAMGFWFLSLPGAIWASGSAVHILLTYLALLNAVLAIFNLLPAFPLDGGRVLRAILWSRTGDILAATETAARVGEVLALALVAMGVLSLFQGVPLGGAWQILIGTFILFAARGAVAAQRRQSRLGHQTIADLMSTDLVTATPELPLSDLVNHVMLPNRVSFVPVVDSGVLLGHVDARVLSMIDRENWPNTQVGDVFVSLSDARVVAPGAPAGELLKRFAQTGDRKLLVIDQGQLAGVVTLSDLGRYLGLLHELHLGRAADAL